MDLSRDRIEKKIAETSSDKKRIDLMNEYAYKMNWIDVDYLEELAERALFFAVKSGYSRGAAFAKTLKGYYFLRISRYPEARSCFEENLRFFNGLSPGESRERIITLNGMGLYYLFTGDLAGATDFFREALNLSESTGASGLMGTVYLFLGLLYIELDQLETALEYARKSCNLLQNEGSVGAYVGALNNNANLLNKMGNYPGALRFLKEAYGLVCEHKVKMYYAVILNTLGEVYENMGSLNKAVKFYRKGLKWALKSKLKEEEIPIYAHIGSVYLKKNDVEKAKKFLKKAYRLSKKTGSAAAERKTCELLIKLYKITVNYKKTCFYLEELYRLNKVNFDLEANKKIRNVEVDIYKKANKRIKLISEIGHKIISTLNIKEVMDIITQSIHSLMDAPICGIAKYQKASEHIFYEMFIEDGCYLEPVSCSLDDKSSLSAYAIRNREDILINDINAESGKYLSNWTDSYFGKNKKMPNSMLFTLLIVNEQIVGVLTVQSYNKNAYTLTDLDSLKILSTYIVTALNNARQIEKEMEVAKRIQTAILPRDFSNKNFDIYGVMLPADHVGGDYFDFIVDKKGQEWFCIGDVTNHGLTPGLIMMMTQSVIKTIIEMNDPALNTRRVVNKVNEILYGTIRNRLKLEEAMTLSVFHHVGGGKIITSGLHEDILIYRKKTAGVEVLSTYGMWIGFLPSIENTTQTDEFQLNPGDVMLLYTDGLIDARNNKKELMKQKRIIELFQQNGEKDPERIADCLLKEVTAFMARQADDITVLVIKRR